MSHLHAFNYNISNTSSIVKLLSGALSKENKIKAREAVLRNLIEMKVSNATVVKEIANKYFIKLAVSKSATTEARAAISSHLNVMIGQIGIMTKNADRKLPTEVVGDVIKLIKQFNQQFNIPYIEMKPELDMLLSTMTVQEMAINPSKSTELTTSAMEAFNHSLSKVSKMGIPYTFSIDRFVTKFNENGKDTGHWVGHKNTFIYKLKGLAEMYASPLQPITHGPSSTFGQDFYDQFRKNFIGLMEKDDFTDEAFDLIEQASAASRITAGSSYKITKKHTIKKLSHKELWATLLSAYLESPDAFQKEIGAATKHLNLLPCPPYFVINAIKAEPGLLGILASESALFSNGSHAGSETKLISYFMDMVNTGNSQQHTEYDYGPQFGLLGNTTPEVQSLMMDGNTVVINGHHKWLSDYPDTLSDSVVISGRIYSRTPSGMYGLDGKEPKQVLLSQHKQKMRH